ncbi:hypothetical protein [Thalassotalea sp. PP2-459]|uniref:hypothetical protein n=1 Tax=Thalassotalea sp. PP2-459 TaxID=1742724 RepID=UPI001115182F|nr:hypothetical protein [Thalassotalea sp. PP2-459]
MKAIIDFVSLRWEMLLFIAIVLGFYAYLILDKPTPKKSKSNEFNWKKLSLPEWLKKMITYPLLGFFTFSVFMILVFVLLLTTWGLLSASYSVGLDKGKAIISKPVCQPLDKIEEKIGHVPGCSIVNDAYGNQLEGRVILLRKDLIVIVTNTESILLNMKKEHLVCAPIYYLSKKDTSQVDHKCHFGAKINKS